MSQFAPPPPQFAANGNDGKPPLVPMKPMLPAGVEQQKQQQPFWSNSTTRRSRQQEQPAPAPTPAHQQPQNGCSGEAPAGEAEANAQDSTATAVALPASSEFVAPQPAQHPEQWQAPADLQPMEAAAYSPHKRQRDGPGEFTPSGYGGGDERQHASVVQLEDPQSPAAGARDEDAAASARQRLQQLERHVAALSQQRAEARWHFVRAFQLLELPADHDAIREARQLRQCGTLSWT